MLQRLFANRHECFKATYWIQIYIYIYIDVYTYIHIHIYIYIYIKNDLRKFRWVPIKRSLDSKNGYVYVVNVNETLNDHSKLLFLLRFAHNMTQK